MWKSLLAVVQPPSAEVVAQEQREEAARMALEHEAAGEHHLALAAMYRSRMARLSQEKGKPLVVSGGSTGSGSSGAGGSNHGSSLPTSVVGK